MRDAIFGWFETPSFDYDLITFGLHGGAQWMGGSVDPYNNILYVTAIQIPYMLKVFASYDLNKNIIVENSFNIQKGFDVSNNEPLGHIPPYYGNSSIKIFHKKTTSRLWTNFAFKKTLNRSNEASDNIDLATDEGWPGWQIINLSFKYDLNKNTKLQLNVENILDVHYITFASGISSPGRSFKFSVNFNY